MSNSDRLTGPDFLDSVADQSDAQGLPVNAAEFRQRATDWRADQARIEQLEADLARLERQLRSDTERARIKAALAQQPAAVVGEEIMVNAAHDVYTLPLQPSGLSSGPRFVVHVSGPEAQAAEARGVVDAATAKDAERYEWLRDNSEIDSTFCDVVRLTFPLGPEVEGFDTLDDAIDAALTGEHNG